METRYAVPYVSGILYRVHPIDVKISGVNARGDEVQIDGLLQPRLEMELQHYVAGVSVRSTNHEITGADFEAVTNGIGAAWEEAFHDTADQFAITHSQPNNAKAIGVPFTLRCDQWKALFRKESPKQVELLVGVYDNGNPKAAGYLNLVFLDGEGLTIRQTNRDQAQAQVDACQAIIDGTSPQLDSRTPEDVAQMKKDAANTKAYYLKQIEQHDNQGKTIGQLSALLSLPDVQTSIATLCANVFTYIKSKDQTWKDIDIQALMVNFATTFQSLIG